MNKEMVPHTRLTEHHARNYVWPHRLQQKGGTATLSLYIGYPMRMSG